MTTIFRRGALLFLFLSIGLFSSISAQTKESAGELLQAVQDYNIGDFKGAEKQFLNIISSDPTNDAAYYYLGNIYYYSNQVDLAEKYLRLAVERDRNNYWYRIKLAQFYANTERVEYAIALYENLKNDYPEKNSLYYDIISLYISSNQIDEALKTLDIIENTKGANEATGQARYELMMRQGKYDEANLFLENFEKEYPSPQTAFILGDLYKNKFIDTTAVKYYSKALAMDPNYTPAYYGLAEVYRMKRQFPEYFSNINIFMSDKSMYSQTKVRYLKEVVFNPQFVQIFKPQIDTMVTNTIAAHPGDSAVLSVAAQYYIITDRTDQANTLYLENIANYPNDLRINNDYTSLLYFTKEWKPLIKHLELCTVKFNNETYLYELLAVAHWQNEDYDKAIETYLAILKNSGKNRETQLNCYAALGDLYHLKNNSRKSFSYYDKALKIDPDNNPVLNNYAYYLSTENKKLKKALAMSQKTIRTEPDNPTYLDTYAWILYLLGDYEEAKKYFKHAMLYGGKESAVILDHYADVLFVLKEYDLAIIYWEQALKLDDTLGIDKKISEKKALIK